MVKKLNYNSCFLTIVAFLCQIILSLLLENNQNLIDDIIIFENTNGDIYLAQDSNELQLYFGTTTSNKEYRIFYGLQIGKTEKYIFQDKDTGEYIPCIKKNIVRNESKEIYNAGLAVLTFSSKTYLLLIGNNDSYIEQLNVNNYSEDLNIFFPSEFFLNNIINKGVSPLIISYENTLYYMFSSISQDAPSDYFISFLVLHFSIPSEAEARLQYLIKNSENFNNIKRDYMSCFGFPLKIYYSCFYLDVDNKYKISFIVYKNGKFVQEEPIEIYSPSNINDNEFIFLKGEGFTQYNAAYAYFSGEENNIPTLMFKTINISSTIQISNTYDEYKEVYLYDYNFNNGIKYNDLVVNEYSKIYSDLYFVSTHINKEFIIIANLIFYISSSTSKHELLIKYYTIQLKDYYNIKIFHGLKAVNFNNLGSANRFLSLAFDFCLLDTCESLDDDKGNAALMVFTYPNKTYDKNLDFIEYALDHNRQYVIANLTENYIINNNIFGYYVRMVYIDEMIDDWWDVEEEDEDGIIYYYEKTQSRVDLYRLDIEQALIRVDLTKYNLEELQYNNIYIKYYIVLSPMTDLEKSNSFCDKINDTFGNKNDENSIRDFKKKSVLSFFNVSINEKMSSNCSDTNCSLCLKNDSNYCIVCKDDNYTIILDDKFRYGKFKLCQKEEKVVTESTEISEKLPDVESSIFNNNNDEQSTIVESEKIVGSERAIIDDLLNNKYIDINLSNEEIKNIYEEIKKYLKENYEGNDIVIRTNNVKIQISSLGTQINSDDISNIDLGECGEKLKLKYCKTENDSLIILKFDIKPENATSTFVKYEVYDPYSRTEIDLDDECPEKYIIIDIPIELEPEMELMYDLLSKSGYNLFNPNSSFYNDICATYTTENGTDILLYDRRMDIYQSTVNISLCQKGCDFHSYEKKVKKAKCQCSVTSAASINKLDLSDVKFEANIMLEKFKQVLQNSNFRVLKCYNLLLKFNLLIKNIGFIIMTLLLLIFIALLIIYKLVSSKRISLYIKEITDYNLGQKEEKEKEQLNKINEKKNKKNKKEKKKKKVKIQKSKDNFIKHKLNGENTSTNTNFFINSDKRKIMSKRINKINKADDKNLLTSVNVQIFTNKLLNDAHNKCDSNYLQLKDVNGKVGKKKNFINGNNIEIFKRPVATRINTPIEEGINHNEENFKKKGKKEINHIKNEMDRINSDKQLYPNKVEDNAKIKELNEQEMNSLEYEEAIRLDKRDYFQYYISLLKKKQLIIFTFFNLNDYNLLSIKISLFLVCFSLYLSINGFFFNDKSMHKIYKENGAFNIINQIPQIFYSSVTSTVINMILKFLSLSEKDILKIKNEKNEGECLNKTKKIEKCIKIKFFTFFIISLILMGFFWYFISCFCAVYTNTQIILFKDTILSFALSMIYPFVINLLPGLFRIPSLRSEKKDKKCFYSLSKILALF